MQYNITQLKANLDLYESLFKALEEDLILWRQAPEKWCLLEIVCHLYDEERDDFRFRTKWVLERPGELPPPFNPLDWVEERQYMKQDFNDMVGRFIAERKSSIHYLQNLEQPNWNNSYMHPIKGAVSAGYYLSNWVAHDYLHIRQILKLKFDFLKHTNGTSLDYAGNW